MSKTIIVAGFGPGISQAVAEKFGAEGFAVALVARNAERLAAGVKTLEANGVRAAAFTADLTDAKALPALVKSVQDKLGPIAAVQWNAYGSGAGDMLAVEPDELRASLDIATTSLVTVVRAALPDLRAAKGAVLVTNGGLALPDPQVDAVGVNYNLMGLSVANAAKHKLVRLLAGKLKADGVYVGEIMVTGTVKGSAFDQGNANLDSRTIASRYWQMYSERSELSVKMG